MLIWLYKLYSFIKICSVVFALKSYIIPKNPPPAKPHQEKGFLGKFLNYVNNASITN